MLKTKKVTSKFPKSVLAAVVATVLVVGVIAYGVYYHAIHSPSSQRTAAINYGPPTAADIQQNNDNKRRIVQDEQSQNQGTPQSGIKAVKPAITYLDQFQQTIEVGGYVGVFEEGGTCTATFTLSTTTITKSVAGVRDASSVDCPVMTVDVSKFNPKGTYAVTLSYQSATSSGVSDPRQIEVK